MTLLSWILCSLGLALSQAEQGVIVQGPLQLKAVPALARLSPDQLEGAQAVWVWSPLREPRRLTPEELPGRNRRLTGGGRTILVRVPAARQMRTANLRLIAAPVEMWSEVPEPLLPSWPVPKSGRLTIPADASRPWRLRVAGEEAGSFWTDLPAGAAGAVVSVVPATGAHSALVVEEQRPAEGASVRVLESSLGRLGGVKEWTFLVSDEAGRFALPGLPDRSELTWLATAIGRPPKRVLSTPSRLPVRIVLSEGATVTGRLLDAAGRPLPGASVRVEAWASQEVPISLIVKAETDAGGRFTAQAVPPGKAVLIAAKSGWAPLRQEIEVPTEGLDVGALSLTRGGSLAVRAVNDAGEPVAGAELRPDLGEPETTGPDGSALFTHLPEHTEIRIVAMAKRHLRADKVVRLPAPGPVELRLQRAFSVTGRFADADGSPLADASVRMAAGRSFDTEALDADGSFLLSLRPEQDYTLAFTSPASAALEVLVSEGGPGEERDLGELHAPAAGEVTGRLVDAGLGAPVPGGRIWCPRPSAQGPLVAWMSRDLLETSSGQDGNFRLKGVPPGLVTLRIEAPGFAHRRLSAEVPQDGRADLGDVRLSPGMTLTVTTGPKGEGAVVFIDPGGEGLIFDRLMAPVVDGAARVEQVPPGAAKLSVNRGPSILCEKEIQVPAEAGELPVECSAERIVVRGVVTLGGRPAGAGVLLWQTEAGTIPEGIVHFQTPSGLKQHQVFTANSPSIDVPVEAGGVFATQELRSGTWQVSFQPDGGGLTEALQIALSGEKEQAVTLPFPGFLVNGTVLDEEGRPVAEARVRELEAGTTVLSGKDGAFRFEGLRAKTYFFSAAKEEATSEPVEVVVGEGQPTEPVILTLGSGGRRPTMAVRVTDERGVPAAGAFVFVELAGRGVRVLTADSSGTASLPLDPPYPETVRAAARIGNAWALGSWESLDRARNGLILAPGPSGSLVSVTEESKGLLLVTTPGGWNLTALLSFLGFPPILETGLPLEIGGLPTGVYELKAGEAKRTVTVREGERVEVKWEK